MAVEIVSVRSEEEDRYATMRAGGQHTVSAVVLNNSAHTDRGSTLDEGSSDDGVGARNRIASAGDGENSVVNALNDLTDAGLDTGLVTEIGNVLSALADDDASLLGGDNSSQGQLSLSILLVGLGSGLAIGAEKRLVMHLGVKVHLETVGGNGIRSSGHFSEL